MKFMVPVLIAAMAIPAETYAQKQINRSIPVTDGQTISMYFDYPEIIRVTTWDGEEISITGTVSINGGENDDAFVLDHAVKGNVVTIRSEIKNVEGLPQRVTVTEGASKITFRDKAAWKAYQEEHGKSFQSVSMGPDIDIHLEIKVPRNIRTTIESVYGMVEVEDFSAPLAVEATYGGVDASIAESTVGELTAGTDFGQIYSNLDLNLRDTEGRSGDFHTIVSAKRGNGLRYSFESRFGNVYLRKAGGTQ